MPPSDYMPHIEKASAAVSAWFAADLPCPPVPALPGVVDGPAIQADNLLFLLPGIAQGLGFMALRAQRLRILCGSGAAIAQGDDVIALGGQADSALFLADHA